MPSHHIINNNEISDYMNMDDAIINNLIDLNNNKSLISLLCTNPNENDYDFINVNIGIASAITSYARIFMSTYLANNFLNVCYTDTLSIYTTTPLSPHLLGSKLGQFKLENYFIEIIFLAPKVYTGKSLVEPGSPNHAKIEHEISKIKGYKGVLSYSELNSLLFKDNSIKLQHNKWMTSIGKGSIKIKDKIYTLSATENKRKLLYNNQNIFIDTQSYIIDNNKSILPFPTTVATDVSSRLVKDQPSPKAQAEGREEEK